jgi:N-glycosylase/DNA lyase
MTLPEPWASEYHVRGEAIRARLDEFKAIEPKRYFYELAFCILTPQSSARNADLTISELERDRFFELGFDPTPYLRNPMHYVRFHNVKSARLLRIRDSWPSIASVLDSSVAAPLLREQVLDVVPGLGMKEASHFLRNIGKRDLAILDRHIFRHLTRLGVLQEIPKNAPTKKRYLEIETHWHRYARDVGIPLDELDLLFWSMETGEIRK